MQAELLFWGWNTSKHRLKKCQNINPQQFETVF